MTEPKPIYEVEPSDVSRAIEEILKKALADNSVYWQKAVAQERKKADDNLRLAAERATTIQELVEDLEEATKTIQELSKELGAAKTEIERLKKLVSAAKHGLASYVYGN